MFVNAFEQETLLQHGFMIDEKIELGKQLKRRNFTNAIYDIYNLGLSIWEEKIVKKLNDILKQPPASQRPTNTNINDTDIPSNIIDTHSTQILDKLQQIITINTRIICS